MNLQIVGVQKAGTTALSHFLAQHPDVCLAEGKEAHVFDQPDYYASPDKQAYAVKRYGKKFLHYRGEKIVCDATPVTLANPTFLKECVEYNPHAKFIVLLRDPVERAVSHYRMSYQRGRESRSMLMSFLLESWRLRKEKQNSVWGRKSPWRDRSYLRRGEYKKQLGWLFSLVDRSQILVLSQQALLEKHDETLQTVFDFLELDGINIERQAVFPSIKSENTSILDDLAIMYASLYFFVKNQRFSHQDK
ncbi:sulfotransferase family protein [Aestuariibacter salexigens]|uniref:sulfotransferase family protein n=1 Tax=Aestuariibacter salexigens TaxID=226010 RepID=UPI0005506B21|nr:sulfotransferase [Aestuariibacter salexigens]